MNAIQVECPMEGTIPDSNSTNSASSTKQPKMKFAKEDFQGYQFPKKEPPGEVSTPTITKGETSNRKRKTIRRKRESNPDFLRKLKQK